MEKVLSSLLRISAVDRAAKKLHATDSRNRDLIRLLVSSFAVVDGEMTVKRTFLASLSSAANQSHKT